MDIVHSKVRTQKKIAINILKKLKRKNNIKSMDENRQIFARIFLKILKFLNYLNTI